MLEGHELTVTRIEPKEPKAEAKAEAEPATDAPTQSADDAPEAAAPEAAADERVFPGFVVDLFFFVTLDEFVDQGAGRGAVLCFGK